VLLDNVPLEGKTLLDVSPHAGEVQAALRDDGEVLRSGAPRHILEERLTDASGNTHILQTTKMPFIAAGTREPAVLGIAVDISQRKQTEETLAAEILFLRAQTAIAHVALSSLQADVLIPQLLASICKAQDYAYGFFWRLADDGRAGIEARVEPFLFAIDREMKSADLVVCRAGATTLAELTAAGRPSILIPLPTATDDHQRKNADALVTHGAARMIDQRSLTGELLAAQIVSLAANQAERDSISAAARRMAKPDAARLIVDRVLQLAGK
jgi:hypothetical protein